MPAATFPVNIPAPFYEIKKIIVISIANYLFDLFTGPGGIALPFKMAPKSKEIYDIC